MSVGMNTAVFGLGAMGFGMASTLLAAPGMGLGREDDAAGVRVYARNAGPTLAGASEEPGIAGTRDAEVQR